MSYIAIGKALQPFRLEGYFKVLVYSEIPERLLDLKTVYFQREHAYRGYIIEDVKITPAHVLLKLRGIDDRNSAQALATAEIWVPESQQIELPEDTYFVHELIGLQVFDGAENIIGIVTDVYQIAGNDVYEVREGTREVLIPAVSQFIKKVDIAAGKMVVELIEGMIE